MNTPGHYWCDKCDDPAFGRTCQACHAPARWIPDAPARGEATKDHKLKHTHQFTPVAPERAKVLFATIRHNLNHLNLL